MSHNANILVLEDDEELRDTIIMVLEDADYAAHGANCAEKAIELAIRHPFELAVSDVRMAGNLDGLGAMDVLKRRNPGLRIIIVTGYATSDAPSRAAAIQVDDYLHKPFPLATLLSSVKQALNKGEEKFGYSQLLKRAFKIPLEKADEIRRHSLFQALETLREQVLDGYYVKIRANDENLSRGAALDIWDRLEPLEVNYQMLSNYIKEFPGETIQRLGQEYRHLQEIMTLKAQNQSVGSSEPRGADKVDRGSFLSFYEKIQSGQISSEQVKIAAFVRRLPERQHSQETRELYSLLWDRRGTAAGFKA